MTDDELLAELGRASGRTAYIMPRRMKRRLVGIVKGPVLLSPGDRVMGYRFDRVVVMMKLEGRDAEWRDQRMRCRMAPGCEWVERN